MTDLLDDLKSLNIHQRIHAVMKDVRTIKKENKKVNGQYTFVSHDEVTRELHDAFVNHGIVMIPTVLKCEEQSYTEIVAKWDDRDKKYIDKSVTTSKTSVEMRLTFINIDNPKDCFDVSFPGMGIDNQDKGIGKAISYAVKYALLKTFCLETSDDVEKDNIDYAPQKQQRAVTPKQATQTNQPAPTPQLNSITNPIDDIDALKLKINDILRSDGGVLKASIKVHLNKTDVWDLTNEDVGRIMQFIETDIYKSEVKKSLVKKVGDNLRGAL